MYFVTNNFRSFSSLALVGLFGLSLTGTAEATGERCYVLRDGRKIRLIQSTSEYGVSLTNASQAADCARRMARNGQGLMKNIAGAEDARFKIVQVDQTSAVRRAAVSKDPAITEIRPVYRFEGIDSPMVSSGTLLVRVKSWLKDADREELWKHYRLGGVKAVDGLKNVYRVQPSDADGDEVAAAELLAADSRVVWSQPNFRRVSRTRQFVPTDPYFQDQWHLENTGQSLGTSDADIDATAAWEIGNGQDITLGIFDDAVDVDHEDLKDNYTGEGQDVSLQFNDDDYPNPRPKLIGDRHGTSVIGLAVARSSNSLGGTGVSFLSKFTASRGLGELLTAEQIATAFTFARQEEVDVHINSWGRPGANEAAIEDAIRTNFNEGRPITEGDVTRRLGMVVVFASGNEGFEYTEEGFDYSTMPEVIGVGASNDDDVLASYSNYGVNISVLAPSGDDFHGALISTDNEDDAGYIEDGYNVGGEDDFGNPELDSEGKYTQTFSGTSAACPVAAGVAALVLSVNSRLTARDVKLILEHTCEKINAQVAQYNGITNRSKVYGYGRINAHEAALAADQSLDNGDRTWPDRVSSVDVVNSVLSWRSGIGTNEFLVVESDSPFGFIPVDGACYDTAQVGCLNLPRTELPPGVTALAPVPCGIDGICDEGDQHNAEFLQPAGKKYFGIYARSSIGRYSFGVSVDSEGEVDGGGPVIDGDGGGDGDGDGDGGDSGPIPPRVTISVTPLEGESPLTVTFQGNAISTNPIDDSRTEWDFDINSTFDAKANTRNATHTYVVDSDEQTFTARLTMYDTSDPPLSGSAQVMITVRAPATGGTDGGGSNDIRILVGVPGTPGSDVDSGISPFEVELRVDASTVVGSVQSISWDLGDGEAANSVIVRHTYVNTSGTDQVFPVTAGVTTVLGSRTETTIATRLITVRSGTAPNPGQPDECIIPGSCPPEGSGVGGCTAGFIPLFTLFAGFMLIRVRRYHLRG